jgi:hypothetical protein
MLDAHMSCAAVWGPRSMPKIVEASLPHVPSPVAAGFWQLDCFDSFHVPPSDIESKCTSQVKIKVIDDS